MYEHITKNKGDIGLGFVIADALSNNIQIALPLSEHLPFDCIFINKKGKMLRISVKYRKIDKSGNIGVAFKSTWSNSNGCQIRQYDKKEFDATAIYCPTTKKCYYIKNSEVQNLNMFTLRIKKPKKIQKTIRLAKNFAKIKRLFK
ncbi:MAG: group I intron-associated PD-(D/E)XK endonuclease [Candidatus Caldatribacteriota bacterium]